MKNFFLVFSIFLLIYPAFVFAYDEDFTPNASSAILIDNDTKEVLYSKDSNKRTSVASLTKMVGLIIIMEKLEDGSLKTNEILTVSKNAKEMGGTQLWLEEGEKISVDDLLKGITMASANDAMVVMAERISGTEAAFVKKMNDKVKKIGLKNTNFVNCTGFDEKNAYSTAYDMSIIASELLKHPKILEYTSKYESYIRENTNNKTWITNTNKLVKFYEGVDGLKTGYTDNAGSSIAVTAKKDGLRLIGISFGYKNTKTRNSEMMSLLDYGFKQYTSKVLFKKGDVIKKISLPKSDKNVIDLVTDSDVVIINKIGDAEKKCSYYVGLDSISFPIKKGDKLGTLYLKCNNKFIKEVNLITNYNIKKASLFKQYIKVLFDVLNGDVI